MWKWLVLLTTCWGSAQVDFDQHLTIDKEEYRARRETLRQTLDAPLILMAAPHRNRINDTDYEFRQESQFYYLTGLEEPDAFLVLSKEPFAFEGQSIHELLFVEENDPAFMTWVGKRLGTKGAMEVLGIQKATPLRGKGTYKKPGPSLFEDFLKNLTTSQRSFYLNTPIVTFQEFGSNASYADSYKAGLLQALNQVPLDPALKETQPPIQILPLDPVLYQLTRQRQQKSPAEIAMLQRAVDVTVSGHRESFRVTKSVPYEYQVEAAIEFAFRYNGAEAVGYNSIVGCGPNGTVLHYDTNRGKVDPSQMFVLDAGAEYRNYTADITRSFPADGTFSKEQATIYQIVREAQDAGAKYLVPGSTRAKVDSAIKAVLVDRLVKLGLITYPQVQKKVSELLQPEQAQRFALVNELRVGEVQLYPYNRLTEKDLEALPKDQVLSMYDEFQYRQICPHGWGHSVGLDVHDPVLDTFEPNMVYTIEPGIYINDRLDFPVDPAYLNIGCRIEDMYLTTATGNVWMSKELPREIPEIEAFMKTDSHLLLERHRHKH